MQRADILFKTFSFKAGSWDIQPTYWQAAAIIFLLFLLVLTLARLRHMYVHWSLKGGGGMIVLGFFLALIIEGFLLLAGKTLLTEVLGWQNAPKPISTALDEGRKRLVNVLGVNDEIPNYSSSVQPSYQSVISQFEVLSGDDKAAVKVFLCEPDP